MPAPYSIIIPTLEAEAGLPATLDSLLPGVAAGLLREVIISDGGSRDATCRIAEEAGAKVLTGPPGRGGQLARGAAAARGAWLLFLHADTHLPGDWVGACQTHAATCPEMAAAFRLSFRARGPAASITAGWANFRSRTLGLPYGDQGLLIPRALYNQSGGYPDLPLMEDVALARALKGRIRLLDSTVSTSPARYEQGGWLRRGARNLWLLTRYLTGADPAALARAYRKP